MECWGRGGAEVSESEEESPLVFVPSGRNRTMLRITQFIANLLVVWWGVGGWGGEDGLVWWN